MQSGRQAKPRLEASQEVHAFMALYKAHSAAIYGIDAHLIDVEVDLYFGVQLVQYPGASARTW